MRKNYERKKVIGLFFKISEKCQYIVYFENKGNQSCLYTCCWCMMCTVCCTFVFVWISPVWLFCLCPFSVLALKDLFFFFFFKSFGFSSFDFELPNGYDFHLLTLSYPMVMIFIFWLWATQWRLFQKRVLHSKFDIYVFIYMVFKLNITFLWFSWFFFLSLLSIWTIIFNIIT